MTLFFNPSILFQAINSSSLQISVQKNISLEQYNTFGIDVKAAHFVEVATVADFKAALETDIQPVLILGGGSNMLLTQDQTGLVLKNNFKGIEVIEQTDETAVIAVGGGENWHELVLWTLSKNLGGIENLSLIPGTVGAAPIQNIGAYGVELEDVFVKLEALSFENGEMKVFQIEDCRFGYRDSVFKNELKGKYFISKVFLKLTRRNHEIYNSYGAIRQVLSEKGVEEPTIQDISRAVIEIRSSKLPDPKVLGNSGSFFKNPEIEKEQFTALQKQFPILVFYELPNDRYKIPAGWLIDQCGWKGLRVGNTGCHAKQALVLVNYGGATGNEVWQLALKIRHSVKKRYGIELTPEVNVL